MQMQRMYSHGSRAFQIVMSDDKLSANHKYNAQYLQKLCKGVCFQICHARRVLACGVSFKAEQSFCMGAGSVLRIR